MNPDDQIAQDRKDAERYRKWLDRSAGKKPWLERMRASFERQWKYLYPDKCEPFNQEHNTALHWFREGAKWARKQ